MVYNILLYRQLNRVFSVRKILIYSDAMKYLPINIQLKHKPCLVLGGGAVALRKIQMLLKAEAQVTCVALQFNAGVRELADKEQIVIQQADVRDYLTDERIIQSFLIISATDDRALGEYVHQRAESLGTWTNTVDEKDLCHYITPAIVDRDPVIVSISSSGEAPVLARRIREHIEKVLPANLGLLAQKAGSLRSEIKQRFTTFMDRRKFWERFFSHSISDDIVAQKQIPDDATLIETIAQDEISEEGEVYLIGAGPGDPELLTIKALRLLQQADVVLYDQLVSPEVLELVRRDAELISVGKSAGNHSVQQDTINDLLVKHAAAGKRVCRLKGGDPFVFGRGGEELDVLAQKGIRYQIVPGITAAVGCSAYAGIPLTHREFARNVLFITAHCKNSIDALDWTSLAREKQTIAVYMGLLKSEELSANLIRHGKDPKTPLALVENGTRNNQRVIRGTLENLSHLVTYYEVKSPTMIFIGEVVGLAEHLKWFKPEQHLLDEQTYFLKSA